MDKSIKKIFSDIEKTRSKNNKNWMDLLRLSFESNPKKTLEIVSEILKKDEKLIKLAKKLKKKTK
jgi:hypothetical protein|tara:strand:+ start:2504 stop:2698 length:195 start_codon:yes stop_codon:yes gene_type:complete